jgi:phospholipase C
MIHRPRIAHAIALCVLVLSLPCGCALPDREAETSSEQTAAQDITTLELRGKVDTIVVIYAENRAFDNLYGNFPGARNLSEVVGPDGKALPGYYPQVDRDGSVLPALPPAWGGVTAYRTRIHAAVQGHPLDLQRDARSVASILRTSDAN